MEDDDMHMSPPPANSTGTQPMNHAEMMTTHMTFYWGKKGEILFSGWPGDRTGMYALALIVVFVMATVQEWLSRCRPVESGLVHTLLHAIRMGVAYMVMLALMSFNAGVFLAAVVGHAVGFLAFRSMGSETTPLRKSPSTTHL